MGTALAGQIGHAAAQGIVDATKRNGGGTWVYPTFIPVDNTWYCGYGVGVYPERSVSVPLVDFTPTTVTLFIANNGPLIEDENDSLVFGTWIDEGRVVIDVVRLLADNEDALVEAVRNEQQAYYDFARESVIIVADADRRDYAE